MTGTENAPVTSINDSALDLNQTGKQQAEAIRLDRQAKKSLALLIIAKKATSFHVWLPREEADLFGLHVRESVEKRLVIFLSTGECFKREISIRKPS